MLFYFAFLKIRFKKIESCLWRIANYFVPNKNIPTEMKHILSLIKESYFVINKNIITFKTAFVCEVMPVRFSNESNTFVILLFLFDRTGFFVLDRVGATPFRTTDTTVLQP